MLRSLALAAAALALAIPAHAQWKWKDPSGRVQYSDLPPPVGIPDRDVLQRPTSRTIPARADAAAGAASAASAPGAGQTLARVDPELEARRKKAEQDAAAGRKADEERAAALRTENCSRARTALRTLEDGGRSYRVNDKGEREYFDDRQRADEARRARDVIASDCR